MNFPNFPVTRHFQRYEYVVDKGYVTGKNVLDIGCSYGAGTAMLVFFAKEVVGIDPCLEPYFSDGKVRMTVPTYSFPGKDMGEIHFYPIPWEGLDRNNTRVDVVVAMELIEHLRNPEEFLDLVAEISEYLFLSTPLADKTSPTRNPLHVVEFNHEDLVRLVSKRFDILDTKYQTGDLRIVDVAGYKGSSLDINHIVQMLWCRRKEK